MGHQVRYSSHLPVLIKIIISTTGNVLELGAGIFSTPVLHWLCSPNKRKLVSYDNDPKYFNWIKQFEDKFHTVIFTDDWDTINIEQPWEVAFLDHKPRERRKEDIKKLANLAKYIIIHDSCGRTDKYYHYSEIYPLFKYLYTYKIQRPHTTVLSNFIDLKDFSV